MSGWVKSYRKTIDSVYGKNLEMIGFFTALLWMANHKEGFTADGTKILPGQFMTSQVALASKFKISRAKVQRLLKKLEIEQQIEQRSNFQNTIITIVNWSKYQDTEHPIEQRVSSDRAASEQRPSTNKNAKNVKNKKEGEVTPIFTSPLNPLFEAFPEVQAWLSTGNQKTHLELMATFDEVYLVKQVLASYEWKIENKKPRMASTFIVAWIERDKSKVYKPGMSPEDQRLRKFFIDSGCKPDRLIS